MTSEFMGKVVRDRRSGVTGRVVGVVEWLENPIITLVIQPPVRQDMTVPPTVYVQEPSAEVIPQLAEPPVQ